MQVSENERFVGVYSKDSTITLIDTSHPEDYLVFNTLLTSVLPRNLFDFSRDGTSFIYLDENNDDAITRNIIQGYRIDLRKKVLCFSTHSVYPEN